jgi:hypothetical protein
MFLLRQFRRRFAWVMLVTLVLASLLPSLTRAAAFVQGDTAPWSAVCTAAGTVHDPAAAPVEARHLLERCALCLLQADGLGLPPDLQPRFEPVVLGRTVPMRFLRAPRPLHAWSSAQPRAPPRPA